MIDACAVALRFAAATLSRDTLRSGQVTVGRAEAREIAVRTSTIPIHVATMPNMQRRTKHEHMPCLARRPALADLRHKSLSPALSITYHGHRNLRVSVAQHGVIDACAVAGRFAAATLSRDTLRSGQVTVGRAVRKEPITNGYRGI